MLNGKPRLLLSGTFVVLWCDRGLRLHRALLLCVLQETAPRPWFGSPALPVLQCGILLWPRFSPTSNTLHLLPWVVFTLPISMGRPMTCRGRKPTSSSASFSSTGEFRNLLSVLCTLEFCFICSLKLLRKGTAVGGGRLDDLAVLDLSRASDEGVVKARV